jgi:hypothetical protein
MINDYLRGRVSIESVRGSVEFKLFPWLELFLTLLCHFAGFYRFSCRLLCFTIFLLLDDILELFLTFWVF